MPRCCLLASNDPRALADAAERARKRFPDAPGTRDQTLPGPGVRLDHRFPPTAPVDVLEDIDGAWIAVLGDLGEDVLPGESPARSIARLRSAHGTRLAASGRDGMNLVAIREPDGTLTVGTDPLGYFPAYWGGDSRRVAVAGTPDSVVAALELPGKLDPAGLVGILLAMYLVEGRCLISGVRRIAPGNILVWKPGTAPRELAGTPFPFPMFDPGTSAEDHARAAIDALQRAVDSQRHDGDEALLLSGGVDSRLLAGLLDRRGRRPVAITLGEDGDQEMRVARKVAQALGWEHRAVPVCHGNAVEDALRLLDTEHLSGGFNHLLEWDALAPVAAAGGRLWTGLAGDHAMDGIHAARAWVESRRTYEFEPVFGFINRFGFSIPTLRAALRPEAGADIVADVADTLASAWDDIDAEPWQKAWWFGMRHRPRYHNTAMGWRIAGGSWPVLPYAARPVLEAMAGIPPHASAGRRLQIEPLVRDHPRLARLPLDRNSHDTTPLVVDSGMLRAWNQTGARAVRRAKRWISPSERRFFYRVYDLNGSGWRAIRREAERHRDALHLIFKPEAVDRLLPRAEATLSLSDGIVDATPIKTLLGLALWLPRHIR
ncbi:MAG: asparagine synthase-related protein [Armatimonadota bacterium]